MINRASIENLKTRIDIVEIIGSYIDIKRVGSNYAARCPFHNEKTPSFMISPSKGIFHCYGCDIGGDAITFVMEYDKISFSEAIEKIADMLNFTLEYDTKQQPKKTDTLDKIAAFYHMRLLNTSDFLEYLPPETSIHRLAGNGLKKNLIAPRWLGKKLDCLNKIDREFIKRNSYQGIKFLNASLQK